MPTAEPEHAAQAGRTAAQTGQTAAQTGRTAAHRSPVLHLRQVIAPATTFAPATSALIRRSPAAPPPGTPRSGSGPRVPGSARNLRPRDPGGRSNTGTDGWTATGTSFRGALPGTLAPAGLAALGATMTGTTHISRMMARPASATGTAAQHDGAGSDMTIRRALDVPSVSSLFERAKAWFSGADDSPGQGGDIHGDPTSVDAANRPAAELQQDPGSQIQPHDAALVERQRSLSNLLRSRSPMTEINDRATTNPVSEALSPREWDQLVDLVVERIEDRVRDELARRGRRFSPGVF